MNLATVPANAIRRQAKELVLTNVHKFVLIYLNQATVCCVMEASFAGQPEVIPQIDIVLLMSVAKMFKDLTTST